MTHSTCGQTAQKVGRSKVGRSKAGWPAASLAKDRIADGGSLAEGGSAGRWGGRWLNQLTKGVAAEGAVAKGAAARDSAAKGHEAGGGAASWRSAQGLDGQTAHWLRALSGIDGQWRGGYSQGV